MRRLFLGLSCLILVVLVTWGRTTPAQTRPASPTTCAIRPPESPAIAPDLRPEAFSLDRFRPGLGRPDPDAPPERVAIASPANYGDRFFLDANGEPAYRPPIIVLHETVSDLNQTLRFFQTPHRSGNQASYHTVIDLRGGIVYVVPPDKRAFGAGNSVFNQTETVLIRRDLPPSVNNFAYHISLETPADGANDRPRHSGYTPAQYRSLAWLLAKTGVPQERITTHRAVDRSGSRFDPRSFDFEQFYRLYNQIPLTQEIAIGCQNPFTGNN